MSQETLSEYLLPYWVRLAELEDADLIGSLIRKAWAGIVAPEDPGHRLAGGKIKDRLERGGGFILERENVPIATLQFLPLDESPFIWELVGIAVIPEHRGQRMIDRLMESLEMHARSLKVRELRLAVRSDKQAPDLLKIFERYRYRVDLQVRSLNADPRSAPPIVMRKMLQY